MGILTMNEQILLTAILRLGDNAYGVPIRDEISELSGKDVVFGTLYNNLDKLVRKGYVTTRRGEPTNERGGRYKIYYQLTEEGLASLEESKALQMSLWKAVPSAAEGGSES